MKYRFWEMSWREALEAFERSDIAIVPVGSIHHHGINIIGDDSVISQRLADEVGKKTGLLTLPLMPYGESEYHKDYPCINIKQETLTEIYKEICKSLYKFGIRKVIFINGHGGNRVSLRNAGYDLREDPGMLVAVVNFWKVSKQIKADVLAPEQTLSFIQELAMNVAIVGKDAFDLTKHKPVTGLRNIFGGKIKTLGFGQFEYKGGVVEIPMGAWDEADGEEGGPIDLSIDELYEGGLEIIRRLVEWISDLAEEIGKIDVSTILKPRPLSP